MTNFNKRCAFTLSELLLSLIIVGVIAVITVPVLVGNAQKRMFATKLKNTVAEIEQVAQNELIRHRTRDLSNTDFSSVASLLSDKHFAIVKTCNNRTIAKSDCWKTTATGSDKVTYKQLSGTTFNPDVYRTIILKNGIMIAQSTNDANDKSDVILRLTVDLNGNEKPNIAGRDYFQFYITKKGRIVDYIYAANTTKYNLNQLKTKCKTNTKLCFPYLLNNGWKMDY